MHGKKLGQVTKRIGSFGWKKLTGRQHGTPRCADPNMETKPETKRRMIYEKGASRRTVQIVWGRGLKNCKNSTKRVS